MAITAHGVEGWHARATRRLAVLLAAAIAVSVVHYADNFSNYADFPLAADVPNPSRTLVGVSWFAFTAAGIAGFLVFRRRPSGLALALLALYSGSGLVGLGHYAAEGALDMPVLRQAHIVADIALGAAVLAFVLSVALRRRSAA
jgi:hypothetical protein